MAADAAVDFVNIENLVGRIQDAFFDGPA